VLQQTTLPARLRAQELAYVLPYYWSKNDTNWGLAGNYTPLGTSPKHFYSTPLSTFSSISISFSEIATVFLFLFHFWHKTGWLGASIKDGEQLLRVGK
jgi:hypothetical protein